jgi:hypothetical protein
VLVVQGLCAASGGIWLWAERTDRWGEPPPDADSAPRRHPFAAEASALSVLTSGEPFDAGPVEVLLPSTSAGPVPSPDLVRALRDADPVATGARPRRWQVDAVRPAVPVNPRVDEVVLGSSARFVVAVDAFAVDLVDRGRILPGVGREGTDPLARWVPVLTGPDADRFDALADAMPPACRAVAEDVAAGTDPAEALAAALGERVDEYARARLREARVTLVPGARPSRAGRVAADWLRALGGDPRFIADEASARRLVAAVGAWRSGGSRVWPMRVCFRLHEPGVLTRDGLPGDPDAWRVELLVQSVEDPAVRVPASEIWRRQTGVLASWAVDAEASLLAGLGRAVSVWPELGRALRDARPVGVDLTRDQAQAFLGLAGALEQEGFGVLVPSWWTRPVQPAPRLTVRAANPVTQVLRDVTTDLDRIVDFRWSVSLGDLELGQAEFDRLTETKAALVSLRGRWTRVDPGALAAIDLSRLSTGGRLTLRDVLALAGLGPTRGHGDGVDIEVIADGGWLGDLLAGETGQPDTGRSLVEPPAGLGVELRLYQRHGLSWLALLDRLGVGAVLADDMGLGKTIQVLALELHTRADGPRPATLVVSPTSVLGNWLREAERVTPTLRVHTHHGPNRRHGTELTEAVAAHDLVLTTYAQLARDVDELAAVSWDRLVLDEAQQIKNAATAQARAARRIVARHRVALTGTPVENRLADLWAILRVVNPGLLGSAGSFRARYAVPVERYADADATARLRRRIRPVVLRRVKTDPSVLRDLPEKVELRQLCTLTPEQASLYRAVVDDMMERLRDRRSPTRRNGVVLAAMTRLKQICNHPAHLLGDGSPLPGRSGKLARLEELLAQVVDSGERALCFTQFARFGGMLAPYLSSRLGVEVAFLHGGLRAADRDRLVERFQSGTGPGVFLLSLKAGGTGVNLTAANHVIHIDRWWNPAVEAQATDRAYRIGQRRDVWVRTMVCMGTLEERIDRILEDKAALARTVVGGGESWLASLSADDLRDLVALAPDAVQDD